MSDLEVGMDFRLPEYRREVFLRFYSFHLRHKAHPGAVYALMPWLREQYSWGEEEALWFALLNGNTQNPITSLELWRVSSGPTVAAGAVELWSKRYAELDWDTDRRYHKKSLPKALESYTEMLGSRSQAEFWQETATGGWQKLWQTARSISTFGRLSAWSYLEYLSIMGVPVHCDDLMLYDIDGSRSHRNGLCKVLGRDDLDWHSSNPSFKGYTPAVIEWLTEEADTLLREAQSRESEESWAGDVNYLTLESALCTFKSWFRPNRRYPGVYLDMLYDRIKRHEMRWGSQGEWWAARRQLWPARLLLEMNIGDPGVAPLKQNWFLNTGQVINMEEEWPCFANEFNSGVREQLWGTFRL